MTPKPETLVAAERDLVELYRSLCPNGPRECVWDQPFLAGCGPRYREAAPKLLAVGQATMGWSDVEDPANPGSIAEQSNAFILEPTAGGFFRHMRDLSLCLTADPAPANPLELVAWSNLARIGYARHNPVGEQFEVQQAICERLLRAEIDWLQPDLILLLTGNYQHQFVSKIFAGIDWRDLPGVEGGNTWHGRRNGSVVVWTMHPGRRSAASLAAEREAIARLLRRRDCSQDPLPVV